MPSAPTPATTKPARLIGLLVLLSSATVALTTTGAAAGTPTGYVGTVTVDGQPAAGSTLAAHIGGTRVGECTVSAGGTYHLELNPAALDASLAGATVRFTLNDQAVADTAVLRLGTMQTLAVTSAQPAPAAQRIASVPAAAPVPAVATPAAQRIASAPSPSPTPVRTSTPAPAVAAAAAPAPQRVATTPVAAAAPAAAPAANTPVTQVASAGTGPAAQQVARIPTTPRPSPSGGAGPAVSVAPSGSTIVLGASAPVARAPASQRAAGTTPTQLPSTGVGGPADTTPSHTLVLGTVLVTMTLLGAAFMGVRRRGAPR
jgi:hypothetical protein